MRRIVLILSLAATVFVCAASGAFLQGTVDPDFWKEFHRNDIRAWAAKSGLSIRTIEEMLAAVGRDEYIGEDTLADAYSIQNIDPRSLANRQQVLVALTGPGTGHALSVFVIQARRPYTVIWDAGDQFVTESILGEATASVSPQGEILVKLPEWNGQPDEDGHHKSVLLVTSYGWTGKTYKLLEQREYLHYRSTTRDYVGIGAGVVKKND